MPACKSEDVADSPQSSLRSGLSRGHSALTLELGEHTVIAGQLDDRHAALEAARRLLATLQAQPNTLVEGVGFGHVSTAAFRVMWVWGVAGKDTLAKRNEQWGGGVKGLFQHVLPELPQHGCSVPALCCTDCCHHAEGLQLAHWWPAAGLAR